VFEIIYSDSNKLYRPSDIQPKINTPINQGTKPIINHVTKQATKQASKKQHNVRSLTSHSINRHISMHVATRTVYLYTHAWPEHLFEWSKNEHSIQHDAATFWQNNFTACGNTYRRFLAAMANTKWDITPLHTKKNTLKGKKTFHETKFCSSLACSWRCIFQEDIK